MVLIDILEEHEEEADFLWQQRTNALSDRVYNLDDLAELEERLLAHLDGLVLGEKEAWKLLEPMLTDGELGEVFTAAFVALDSGDAERIDVVIKTFVQADGDIFEGIRNALRHSSYPEIEGIIRPCLTSEKRSVQAAAVDALSFRRLPVEIGQLQSLLNDPDPQVVAVAISAVGRLRVVQLKGQVEQSMSSSDPYIRLEAMRTGLLLGSQQALSHCRKAIRGHSEEAKDALILLGLAGHSEDNPLITEAVSDPTLSRNAITAMGLMGNLSYMDILLLLSANPEFSRLAGEAISMITGVNIVAEKFVAEKPVMVEAGASEDTREDDEDEEFVEDPDEALPFPDPVKLESWWRKNVARFDRKVRYRRGRPHGSQVLMDILRNGSLPERHHAAFEISLLNPSYPYLETSAFCGRQQKDIASMNTILL